jgi:TolB-like protein/DNA-binding winged helix-turn-helix (wHTH) protein/Flp pilus assembly protein TadD
MPQSQTSNLIRFDFFELDLRAGELRKRGIRLRLQEQPFLILQTLLENPGEIVTREELKKKIWPEDTFVDFDHGLHSAVNRLRDALSDSADRPRYVETVSRRGYRFIGRIDSPASPSGSNGQLASASEGGEEKPASEIWNSWTRFLAGFGIAAVIVGLLIAFNVWGLKEWLVGSGSRRTFRALAVLPLDNLSSDPKQDPVADGMTEDLITEISKLPNLKVISHTSVMPYRGSHKTLPQIAQELKVDVVVDGAVQLEGDRVRVTARLVDASSDQQIWAEHYDRELSNVLLLQNEVARDVAKQIDLKLTPQQRLRLQAGARPVVPEAYQAYLLGRYYWNQRTASGLAKAGQYFQEAISKDPNYALAYSGLSDYYAFLTLIGGPEILPPIQAMTQSKAAAVKALQLDGGAAETHTSMAHVLHNYDWDFAAAEREFQRAIELNPNYATAHHLYSHLLMQLGRTDQSLYEATLAQELDPASPFINNGLARQYYLARKYDQAIAQCHAALNFDPAYLPARIQLGLAYEQKGMLKEAIGQLEKARDMAASLPMAHALLAHAYATAGRKAEAQKELILLTHIGRERYVPASYLAIVAIALGDKNQAFAYLQKSYVDRSEQLLYLSVEPLVDPLRSDPRFETLLKKVGLKP